MKSTCFISGDKTNSVKIKSQLSKRRTAPFKYNTELTVKKLRVTSAAVRESSVKLGWLLQVNQDFFFF